MRNGVFLLVFAIFLCAAASGVEASTLFRSDPWEYWTDYSDHANGCRLVRCAELVSSSERDPMGLTGWEEGGAKRGKSSVVFADKAQEQEFVLDFGQKRPVGKIMLRTALSDPTRIPKEVNVYGSNDGADGPWTTLVERGDMRCHYGYMLDNREFRWVRFNFGRNDGGPGCRIKELRIYKRYYRAKLPELMKAFSAKFRRDCPGLEDFWKKIDAKEWEGAASALRTYEEKRHNPVGIPPNYKRNADLALEDKIDFENNVIVEYRQGIDWDFKPEGGLNNTERGWLHAHLARAWCATGDKRYAKKLEEYMFTHIDQCPRAPETVPAKYDHWATLSIGGQFGHWQQILQIIVKDRESFSDELYLNILYSLWEQVDYLAHGGSEGGNWLAVVSGTVLGAGLGLQEFTDYKEWLEFGKKNFVLNVMRDVHPDGKEFENSDHYVVFAYGLLLGNYNMLVKAGVELPPAVHRRMALGMDWTAHILQPNGHAFKIGDSHDGVGGGLARGAGLLFNRPDIVYMATQGKEGKKPSSASRGFPVSGWFVMRSDWEDGPFDQARQLLFTAAPYGPHGHQDQLSVSCYAYGNPLLSVPSRLGDHTYGAPEHWETINSWSKNTVVVDGKTQPLGNEPGVQRRCEELEWFGGKYLDFADAAHPMYDDVIHRRRVVFVRSDYWIVIDDLTPKPGADAAKTHVYDQHFHFMDGTDAVAMANEVARSDFKRGGNLMLIPLEPEKLAGSEKTSTPNNCSGMRAPVMYGWKYTLKGSGPRRFVTVLYPYAEGKPPAVSVRKLDAPDDVAAMEVTTPSGRDVVYVGDSVRSYAYSASTNARARVFVARLDDRGAATRVSGLDVDEIGAGSYRYQAKAGPERSVEVDLREQ